MLAADFGNVTGKINEILSTQFCSSYHNNGHGGMETLENKIIMAHVISSTLIAKNIY